MGETVNVPMIDGRDASDVLTRLRESSLVLDIVIVASVALLLGLLRLGVPSFWVDESFTAQRVGQGVAEYFSGYYPLYSLVMRVWAIAAGTSEWALRLPSVFASMLSCALLVVLGRRLFDRWVGLAAGLLLATSPFVVRW